MEFDQNLNPVEPPKPSNPFGQPPTPPINTPTPPSPRPTIAPPNGRGLGLVLGIVGIVVVAGALLYIGGRPNTNSGQMEGLTVNADATVYASPDIARVNVGVVKTSKTVAEVEKQLSDASVSIKSAITAAGVKDSDIKTVDYNIYPEQTYVNGSVSRISGYNGRHSMEVTIRDLNQTDAVLSAVTKAGANEVGQLNFTLEKPDDKLAEARKEALKKAKDKAKQIAEDGNFRLGRLISINEYSNTPMPYMDGMGGKGGGIVAPSTEPGSMAMQVNVTLVYQIR